MHQVLSYETAVRTNNSREYVSKRNCIALVVAIGFLTLITGYFLGNFVEERKYHIRQMLSKKGIKTDNPHSVEVSSSDYTNLKEMHAYHKSKEKLLASAQKLSKILSRDESYMPSSLNTDIFNKYVSCTQDIPPNTSIESSQFIEQLIDNTAARQRDCVRIVQAILDSNLVSGQSG